MEKTRKGKIWTAIGNFLMLIAIFYIVKYIYKENIDFGFLRYKGNVVVVIILILLSSGSVLCLALAWKNNLELFAPNSKIALKDAVWICAKSNLARYIPGNVAHYASRNIIGIKYGLRQKVMVLASLAELLLITIVSGIIIFVLMFQDAQIVVHELLGERSGNLRDMVVISLFFFLIIIGAVCVTMKEKIINLKIYVFKGIISSIIYLLFHTVNLLVFGGMIIYIFKIGTLDQIVNLGGCYLIAWLIGMITPGAPGGIGIREYILLVLLRDTTEESMILQMAVLMRMITLGGDVLAALEGILIHRIKDVKSETTVISTVNKT